ncbi:MAG: hypothetical protein V1726_04515 [Methanobacteriota archaeon]
MIKTMKIKNIQLKSIEARRYTDLNEKPRQIRIDHNSTITHVSYTNGDVATIEFQYTASYGPIGMIKIDGVLLYEYNDVKNLAEKWNETHKMPDQVASQLHTAVMHTCVPEAVGIAKDLGLPPPIPLPQVHLGTDQKKGQVGGVEVA